MGCQYVASGCAKSFFLQFCFVGARYRALLFAALPFLAVLFTRNRGGTSFKPKVFSLRVPPRFVSSFVPPNSPALLPYFLSSVHSSNFRIPQVFYLPLLRKLPGVSQQFPFRNSS